MYHRLQKHALIGLAYLFCVGWLFYPGVIQSKIPRFRDGYHFYYPQAVWLNECSRQGEIFPTWNSSEGLGVSAAGQPSTAIYYPLRVLWLIPTSSLAQRYSIYMLVHVLIAAAGMGYAARGLGLPRFASWLAAISYSLSCPVVFQHANLIFLCSSAWIGFAIGAAIRLTSKQRQPFRQTIIFSLACGMMLLAGDPHTAVNTLIVIAFSMVARTANALRGQGFMAASVFKQAAREFGWLALACSLIAALTAVQWIPTARWAAHSSRFATESTARVDHLELAEILDRPAATSHHVYDFSLSPWHIATTLWPTLGGHFLPRNSRWFSAIPGEGRMWIPSIYFGCLPCLLVIASLRRPQGISRWLIAIVLLALLVSLGNYSFVWLAREGLNAMGLDELSASLPKDHVASPYWILTQIVPGYSGFRYPGKWTVWFAAAASLLAAFKFEQLYQGREAQPRRSILFQFKSTRILFVGSTICLVASILFWVWTPNNKILELDRWLAQVATDSLLGAPSTHAILMVICIAFSVPVMVFSLLLLCRNHFRAIVWITLIEMTCVASQWIVFGSPPAIPPALKAPADASLVWASPRSDHAFLGKLETLDGPRILNAAQSIEPKETTQVKRWLVRHDDLTPEQAELDRVLAALGVSHRLSGLRTAHGLQNARWIPVENSAGLCEFLENGPTEIDALHWSWESSGKLKISAFCDRPTRLVVRQYNDGGWIAELADGSQLSQSTETLFVEMTLPAGHSEIWLRRKWLW